MRIIAILVLAVSGFTAGQEPNTPGGSLTFNGIDTGSYPISVTVLEASIVMRIDGAPSAPYTLIEGGAQNPGALTFGVGQSIDVGTPPLFADWNIVIDGMNPFGSFLNMFAFTDGSGTATLTLPSGQPGSSSTYNLQAGVWDATHPDGVDVTAASYLSVQPCSGTPLSLGDDAFSQIALVTWTFPFYGTAYTEVFVGSNGYVTLSAGDTGFLQSEAAFVTGVPRIADLWDDLAPNLAGTVLWDGSVTAQATLCRLGVAHFAAAQPYALNTTRVDLDATGNVTMTWPNALQTSVDPLVGLSPGNSLSAAPPINLSASNGVTGATNAAVFEVFNTSTNTFDLTGRAIVFSPVGAGNQYAITVQ